MGTPPSTLSPNAGNDGPPGGYPSKDSGSRNGSKGVIAGAFDLSNRLVSALPPAFLMLVLINALFIALVFWFMDSQSKQRTAMVEKLVDKCMEIALQHEPPAH